MSSRERSYSSPSSGVRSLTNDEDRPPHLVPRTWLGVVDPATIAVTDPARRLLSSPFAPVSPGRSNTAALGKSLWHHPHVSESRGDYTRRIGEGFLREVAPRGNVLDRVLLFDFVTGRPDVLPRHREGLRLHVLPHLEPNAVPCWVWVGGIASRRGDASFNRGLASAHARNIEHAILAAVPSLTRLIRRHSLRTTWHGERYSTHHTENSEFYRSVLVVIGRYPPTSQPRRRPPEPLPSGFNRFRIRMVGPGFEGGEVWTGGSYGFELDYDVSVSGSPSSAPAIYRLRGYAGVGLGAPFGASLPDRDGPWNSFTSPVITTPRGFGGAGSMSGGGFSLGHGESSINLTLRPRAAGWSAIIINDLRVRGWSAGAGYSSIHGPFQLESE